MPFIPALLFALSPNFLIQDRIIPPEPANGSSASLVAAELAFAKQADAENIRAAFLAVLDEDGVLFRPGPVNGRAWLTPRKADAASPVEIPVFKPQPPARMAKPAAAGSASTESLILREQGFATAAAKQGLATAYRQFAAVDLRFYRDSGFPLTNSKDAIHILESSKGATTWTCVGSRVSKSGDLGYAYGYAERAGIGPAAKPASPGKSVFLHLWKRAHIGGWKLVLDIESPLPPEKPRS